ncbi:MAG: hypothetical protein ACI82A_002816 [Candidatus Azotimanducaceae bacterium]|jgi:hypothetical protein
MLLRQQTDSESAINSEIKTLQAQVAEVGDMKALIGRFTQESSEMLTIIDGLEQEIDSLQAQLKK